MRKSPINVIVCTTLQLFHNIINPHIMRNPWSSPIVHLSSRPKGYLTDKWHLCYQISPFFIWNCFFLLLLYLKLFSKTLYWKGALVLWVSHFHICCNLLVMVMAFSLYILAISSFPLLLTINLGRDMLIEFNFTKVDFVDIVLLYIYFSS
jgi:hypothetical protein